MIRDSVVIEWLRVFLRDKLTDNGRLVFWLFLLANATGMASMVVKIYFVWSVLLALLLTSIVASRLARVKLDARIEVPRNTTAGATVEMPLRLSNSTRRAAVDLEIGVLDAPRAVRTAPVTLTRLEPGEERDLVVKAEFRRRGHYTLGGVRQDTLYPWGLWRDTRRIRREQAVLVYPRFHPLVRLDIPVGRRYQPGGIALTSHVGDSTEFVSTREFREGDSVRNIHWRSWARLGQPVVKEFQEEYFCRIALLLDTFVGRKDEETFEAALSLAAAIANRLALEEYVVDLFAAGPEIYHFQAGRSLGYLENVMDILACLEPSPDPPFQKIEPLLLEHMGNVTTTIAIVLDWDDSRARMMQALRDRGSELKIVLVRPTPPEVQEDPHLGRIHWAPPERIVGGGVEDL